MKKSKSQKTIYNIILLYKAQKQGKINIILLRPMCIRGCGETPFKKKKRNEETIITTIKRLAPSGLQLPAEKNPGGTHREPGWFQVMFWFLY